MRFHTSLNSNTTPPSADVLGCTDPTAENYNPLATVDDGSCTYASTFDGGVFLSFDDLDPTGWKAYHDNYGEALGWKATFYLIPYAAGQGAQYDTMKLLYDYGHEMGVHHSFFQPSVYLAQGNTAEDYYNTYVKEVEDQLILHGMPKPTSWRFPYNHLNKDITDDLLANRGYKTVTPGHVPDYFTNPTETNIFYLFDRYPTAMRIDGSYVQSRIEAILDYAKANRLLVGFLGHGIGAGGQTETNLNHLIPYVNSIGLPFLTASEVYDLQGTRVQDATIPTIGTLSLDSYGASGSGTLYITCAAIDNADGYDIHIDHKDGLGFIDQYVYYGEQMNAFIVRYLTPGQEIDIKVKAWRRHYNNTRWDNRSAFSNTITVTPPL